MTLSIFWLTAVVSIFVFDVSILGAALGLYHWAVLDGGNDNICLAAILFVYCWIIIAAAIRNRKYYNYIAMSASVGILLGILLLIEGVMEVIWNYSFMDIKSAQIASTVALTILFMPWFLAFSEAREGIPSDYVLSYEMYKTGRDNGKLFEQLYWWSGSVYVCLKAVAVLCFLLWRKVK